MTTTASTAPNKQPYLAALPNNCANRGHADKREWGHKLGVGGIFMFKSTTEAERAERDQNADWARIDAAIDTAEKSIAALESQQLGPNEGTRKQLSVIRDHTILDIRDVRHNMLRRAAEAKETETWMVVKFLREVRDDRVLREFTADLQEVPTKNFLDYLRYLIRLEDVARIQTLGAVFATRSDRERYSVAFGRVLTEFTLTQCGSLGERIPRIYLLAEKSDARVVNLFCARGRTRLCAPTSQPLAKMEAPVIAPMDMLAVSDHNSGNELIKIA